MTKQIQVEKVTSKLRHSPLLMVTLRESVCRNFKAKKERKLWKLQGNGAPGRTRTGTPLQRKLRILSPNRFAPQLIEIIKHRFAVLRKSYVKFTSVDETDGYRFTPIITFEIINYHTA